MAWYWWLISVIGVVAIIAIALFVALMVYADSIKSERDSKTLLSTSKLNQEKYIELFNRKLSDIEVLFFGELGLNAQYVNSLVSREFELYDELIDSYIQSKHQKLSIKLTESETIEIKTLLYKFGSEFYTLMFSGKEKLKEVQGELSKS